MIINNQFFNDVRNFLKKLSEEYLLPNAGNLDQLTITIKDDNSKVTQFDLFLENELLSFFNQKGFHSIVSEETNNELLNDKCYLTIDPIDGTKNFIDGVKNL